MSTKIVICMDSFELLSNNDIKITGEDGVELTIVVNTKDLLDIVEQIASVVPSNYLIGAVEDYIEVANND